VRVLNGIPLTDLLREVENVHMGENPEVQEADQIQKVDAGS
jgi:hypothetical protein